MKIVFNLIKKHAVLIVLILLAVSLGLFKLFKKKPKNAKTNSLKILDKEGVSGTRAVNIDNIAMNVAHNLGTAYDFYDPRYWSENDKVVFELINALTQNDFDLVSMIYFDVYAKGRTLTSDLAKLLDDEYYKKLTVK